MRKTKKERHSKAESFRSRIASGAQRAQEIKNLSVKELFDEDDAQKVNILLSKTSYTMGCGEEYMSLLARLSREDRFKNKALEFYRRWHG